MDDKGKNSVVISLRKQRIRNALRNYRSSRGSKFVTPLLLVALLAGGGFLFYRQQQATAKYLCNGRESNQFYQEVAQQLYPVNYEELGRLVSRIQRVEGYKKDPNCVYAEVAYYINTADSENAKRTLSDLEKVYDSKNGFVSAYDKRVRDLEDVRSEVADIEKANQENNSNTNLFNP